MPPNFRHQLIPKDSEFHLSISVGKRNVDMDKMLILEPEPNVSEENNSE